MFYLDIMAVGIETRVNDIETRNLLDRIHCRETGLRVKAERAALAVLDGSCRTPIGSHAILSGAEMKLRVVVCSPDGRQKFDESMTMEVNSDSDALALGNKVGMLLKDQVDPGLLTP